MFTLLYVLERYFSCMISLADKIDLPAVLYLFPIVIDDEKIIQTLDVIIMEY
jgi:hypothetical protein